MLGGEGSRQGVPLCRFGELLRHHRLTAGLTQADLGERAGLSVRGIGALEQGERRRPHPSTVRLLADALGIEGEVRRQFEAAARRGETSSPMVSVLFETPPARTAPTGGFLGAHPESAMVGRTEELAFARTLIEEATGGAGRILLVGGEPGIGKTRFAQEVGLALAGQGFLVAVGSCYLPHQTIPFSPFQQALSMLVAQASPDLSSEIHTHFPYVMPLLAESLPPFPSLKNDPHLEGERLLRSVSGLILALAREAPVGLLLDDLQWADTASLDLLLHLARATRGSRVLLLGNYRDTETSAPLEQLRTELGRAQLAEWMVLPRLDVAGTRVLAAGELHEEISEELAAFLYRYTEGNPFFTHEMLRMLLERGQVDREGGTKRWGLPDDLQVPENVRLAIRQRVGRLPADAQDILRQASVLGQRFRFDVLRALAARTEQEVETALDGARRAGVVQEVDAEHFTFDHVLTQQALYGELSFRNRERLHRAAGVALEALGKPAHPKGAAELAWHFRKGNDRVRALAWSLQAGRDAEGVFAHDEAVQQYRSALILAQDLGETVRAAEIGEMLGAVLTVAARYDEALSVLDVAAARYQSAGDLAGEARVVAAIGDAHRYGASPQEGIIRVQEILDRFPDEASRTPVAPLQHGCARLHLALAGLLFATGRYGEVPDTAERAIQLARGLDEDPGTLQLVVEAENLRGHALVQIGDPVGRQILEALVPLAEEVENQLVVREVLHVLAFATLVAGQVEKARQFAERGLAVARQTDDPAFVAYAAALLAWVLFHLGEWSTARAQVEPLLGAVQSLPGSYHAAYPFGVLGLISVAEGQTDEACRHLQTALAIGEQSRDVRMLVWASTSLAEGEILRGAVKQARSRLDPLASEPGGHTMLMLPTLAQACLSLGEIDRAAGIATRALEMARHFSPLLVPDALRAQALVLAEQQRFVEARVALQEAVAAARALPFPYAEARALYEWGSIDRQTGDGVQARKRFAEALVIFRRLGARPYIERAERTLADHSGCHAAGNSPGQFHPH